MEAREAVRLFEVSCRYLVANGFALPSGAMDDDAAVSGVPENIGAGD